MCDSACIPDLISPNKMNQTLIEKIYSNGYADYRSNKASVEDIEAMLLSIRMALDEDYLEFLMTVNGFAMNGLNFFGTKEQPDIYVLSAPKQNAFWSVEIAELKGYFIVADGDMDFYCYNPYARKYYIFTKATTTQVEAFDNFEAMLDEMVRFYG